MRQSPAYVVLGDHGACALPGDGGYHLQAWRLELELPGGARLELEAPRPLGLGKEEAGGR